MSDQVENHDNDDTSVVVSSSVPERDINVSEKDSNYLQLDKISEIDENEQPGLESRQITNLARDNITRSRATFRASSAATPLPKDLPDDEARFSSRESSKPRFYLTEVEGYDNNLESEEESEYNSDDDDLVVPKPPPIFYENNIYDEKSYDTDLEDEGEDSDEELYTAEQMYKKMCDHLNVIPCRYFLAHIEDEKVIMRYHQFSNDEIRALAKPLWTNYQIEKLCLDGNWIEYDGAKYLSRMLRQNDFILELSLADNRLGESPNGTAEVCRMVSENCRLKKLNLAGNLFSDNDVDQIFESLLENKLLEELNFRHNCFGDESGKVLGNYISSNDTLLSLDISWNNLRGKSAKEVALGIKENVRLKHCDVSYNGFDADAGKFLGDVIKNNSSLESLNLSNTRLNADCAACIANALEVNDTLKHLNMTNNPITTSGALAIIYAIKLNTSSVLETLDLSEIPVTKEFENVLAEIQEEKPNFKCMRGPVIMTSNTKSILYEGGTKVDFEKIISSLKKQ